MTFYNDSIFIAVIAYVYAIILTDSEMILNSYYIWMKNHFPNWLFMPLVGCVYCVSGQLSFWYYLIAYFNEYSLINHILFVSAAILSVEIILQTINKLTK